MQHAAEEYQLVVIVDIGSQPLGGGELATVKVAAQAVVGDEWWRDVVDELLCRAGDLGIGEIYPTGRG